jgi:glycosyltransferase involved in cell wall biosynthesis
MRVLIDLRWMKPGVAGGIENLSRSFLNQLLKLDGSDFYTILAPAEVKYDFDLRGRLNFKLVVSHNSGYYKRQLLRVGARLLQYLYKPDPGRASGWGLRQKAPVFDSEVALSIPGFIQPDLYPLGNVLIVPDIQHEYYPEFFSRRELSERRKAYTDSVRVSDHVCAISEFTRQTLIESLRVPPEQITTVHPAADSLFHPQSPYRGNPGDVLKKYGLRAGEYLLFPANTWPHKNHQTAFKALHLLTLTYRLEPMLACTGSPKQAQAGLLRFVRELNLDRRIRFLGYCPIQDMPGLYEGAAALVFPSLFEGFGIPLLEAFWCDCPVVCSNVTSLPEIAGDAALQVDPRSPEALAHALSRVLTDQSLRRTLIERGRQRVDKFSWSNFACETVRILRKVRELRYRS